VPPAGPTLTSALNLDRRQPGTPRVGPTAHIVETIDAMTSLSWASTSAALAFPANDGNVFAF